MPQLVIRWTFGEWAERRTDPQGLSLLHTSIRFAQLLFPTANFVICYNNLIWSRPQVEAIAAESGVAMFDSEPHLPQHLRSNIVKNSWWKYAPPRLNPDGFEFVLDNDVILWRRPLALDKWLAEGGLLALGERTKHILKKLYYGDFVNEVKRVDPYLNLNAGILGWPPGYLPSLEGAREEGEFFLTEQGFSALAFARYSGNKHLIPYTQVPLLHMAQVDPHELIKKYSGGHFCQCTYGPYDYWQKRYQKVVEAFLEESA